MIKREKLPSEIKEIEERPAEGSVYTSTHTTVSPAHTGVRTTAVPWTELRAAVTMNEPTTCSHPAYSNDIPTFSEYVKTIFFIVIILIGLTYPWWKNFL